jgi:hypothetical protein
LPGCTGVSSSDWPTAGKNANSSDRRWNPNLFFVFSKRKVMIQTSRPKFIFVYMLILPIIIFVVAGKITFFVGETVRIGLTSFFEGYLATFLTVFFSATRDSLPTLRRQEPFMYITMVRILEKHGQPGAPEIVG